MSGFTIIDHSCLQLDAAYKLVGYDGINHDEFVTKSSASAHFFCAHIPP